MLFDRVGKPLKRARSFVRSLVLLLCGAVLVACLEFLMLGSLPTGRYQVFAVNASAKTAAEQEVQAGLKGVMSGVSQMEHYSDVTRVAPVADSGDQVLAGVSGVDRRAIRRSSFLQAAVGAGRLGSLTRQVIADNQMPAEEYETLLRIVEAEATGGDVTSKMMVAGVVLNRVADERFPDTIYDVVFQSHQFTPISDGRFYSCTVSEETIEAVDRVLSGENISSGALYFVARGSAGSAVSWFDNNLTWLCSYGGHDYYTY